MTLQPDARAIEALALLDEPNRRRLYELVARRPDPVGRDEAAEATGISRELAAFHLDRLAAAGMLRVEYRRRGERRGPGAGRPAKFYRRMERDMSVSVPPRRYDVAADIMATALEQVAAGEGLEVAASVAREHGRATASQAGGPLDQGARDADGRLVEVLERGGYEPEVDASDGTIRLGNCPYHGLVGAHRELTCGMNLAWAAGLVDGLQADVGAELDPASGRCCVVFRRGAGSGPADGPSRPAEG